MTVMTRPTEMWNAMPGWGIVADLTPPELTASRQLRVLRRVVAAGLILIAMLCAGGFVLAHMKHSDAQKTLDASAARATDLQREVDRYSGVTVMQGTISQVQAQVAHVMGGDVAVDRLIATLRADLPPSMSITQLSVTFTPVTAGSSTTQSGALNTSGHPAIGTVSITGTARTLDDLPAYVDRLSTVAGLVNIVPTNNQADAKAVQFTLSITLTDQLLSHRYDGAKGGK